MRNIVNTEIKRVLTEAEALEREPIRPGEDVIKDRADRRYRLQARFDALLVEACAPGYTGAKVGYTYANAAAKRLLDAWWHRHLGEEVIQGSLLDAMLSGDWTSCGWPPDMIHGPGPCGEDRP